MTNIGEFHHESSATDLDEQLARVEELHRQLRPKIPTPYPAYIRRMMQESVRLSVLPIHGPPSALAMWRIDLTTYAGRRFYVDDLVTRDTQRGSGHGATLLSALEARARELACDTFALDSGVQRDLAHRFYFRAGMTIRSFNFGKSLTTRF